MDLTPIEKAAFELSLQLEMVSHCRLAQAYRSGQVAYARLLVGGTAVGALLLAGPEASRGTQRTMPDTGPRFSAQPWIDPDL